MRVSFYLADQNPHRDRTRGVTVYTDGLLRALSSRPEVECSSFVSKSSYCPTVPQVRSVTLPFRTDHPILDVCSRIRCIPILSKQRRCVALSERTPSARFKLPKTGVGNLSRCDPSILRGPLPSFEIGFAISLLDDGVAPLSCQIRRGSYGLEFSRSQTNVRCVSGTVFEYQILW